MSNNNFSGEITSRGIRILLFYFPSLLILSIFLTIRIILLNNGIILDSSVNETNSIFSNQIAFALIGSISTNLMACSIFYIRKIYKIFLSSSFTVQNKGSLKTLGTILYFMIRPIFSVCFTLLLIIGLKAGLINIFQNDNTISSSFTDVCMFISFFIGFSSGKFLKSIEKKSETMAESLLNS
ncbi:hypothetical protein [uncultured Clostridium sp.]|uniref:hypothetical protein n=1 Tax=uncultured Clostridium sp. TaxID=59620 RepID=UPI0025945486|nr:hypothetical protein [uncultured Clostridium sp.]